VTAGFHRFYRWRGGGFKLDSLWRRKKQKRAEESRALFKGLAGGGR